MTLSGAFAGLAGAVEILGLHHRMFEPAAVSAGYGFYRHCGGSVRQAASVGHHPFLYFCLAACS
ncbi:MAG: hypothetical protein M5U34_38490 [Chloroflexi bacterium]|nr:hypothetical protein [Chloroflexota bacterium]